MYGRPFVVILGLLSARINGCGTNQQKFGANKKLKKLMTNKSSANGNRLDIKNSVSRATSWNDRLNALNWGQKHEQRTQKILFKILINSLFLTSRISPDVVLGHGRLTGPSSPPCWISRETLGPFPGSAYRRCLWRFSLLRVIETWSCNRIITSLNRTQMIFEESLNVEVAGNALRSCTFGTANLVWHSTRNSNVCIEAFDRKF